MQRIDADIMNKKNLFRETLSNFRKGKIDVLVGTQMIAKGLDFPKVTLVGVIDADLPLRMEDFRASERAFQMLVQVSGRAGEVTGLERYMYKPMHLSPLVFNLQEDQMLVVLLMKKWKCAKEFGYPPFTHLIRHLFRSRSSAKVEFYATEWTKQLQRAEIENFRFKGPALAPLEKIRAITDIIFFTSLLQ